MIRSAKEAREIIENGPDCSCNGITESCDRDAIWIQKKELAEAYLAALSGPEVKALVEALEKIKIWERSNDIFLMVDIDSSTCYHHEINSISGRVARKFMELKDKVLDQYREALK